MHEGNPVAAYLKLVGEPVLHSEKAVVGSEIEIIADEILIVSYKKAITVDHIRCEDRSVIERISLAVLPIGLGLPRINLIFDRDIVERRPFKSAAQPKLLCAGGVIGDVVIGRQRARVDRYRPEIVTGKCAHRRAGHDAINRMRSSKRDRHDRRAPIGVTRIFFIFNRAPDHEIVRGVVVELPRDVGQVAEVALDKAVESRPGHIKAVIESLHPGIAARAVVGEH